MLGILHGGAEIGFYIALQLKADYVPLIVQRLFSPLRRQFAFGAVAEDGSVYLHARSVKGISQEMIDTQEELALKAIENRKKIWRAQYPLPNIDGRTVILTDENVTTGATILAAITMCRNLGARRVIIAIPTAPHSKIALLRQHADVVMTLPHDAITLTIKGAFHSEATTDQETLELLQQLKTDKKEGLPQRKQTAATATKNRRPKEAGTKQPVRKSKLTL